MSTPVTDLARWYERTTRFLPVERRRKNRQVLVWNGLVFAAGGAIGAILFCGAFGLGAEGPEVLLLWQFWALLAIFVGMIATGLLMHRVGRALPIE